MKSEKLTGEYRDGIIDRALIDRFEQEQLDLLEQSHELAVRVRDRRLEPLGAARLKATPVGWLPEIISIGLKIGEEWVSLSCYDVPVPEFLKDSCFLVLDEDDPIAKECRGLTQRFTDLNKHRKAAKGTLNALLWSVNTTGQLLTVWPEGKVYLRNTTKEHPRNLPAVNVSALNAMLGLPKEAA